MLSITFQNTQKIITQLYLSPVDLLTALIEYLKVLLDEFRLSFDKLAFFDISARTVSKCENLYSNTILGGDCVITITGENK